MTVLSKWSPCSVLHQFFQLVLRQLVPRQPPVLRPVPRLKSPLIAAMSAPRKEGARKKVVVGCVARRSTAEVMEEMAALARQDRVKLSTPFSPAPRPQGGFSIIRRPPLPRQPPINPLAPPSPDRAEDRLRRVEAAAMTARAHEEAEAYLLSMADEDAARPRSPSPPRDSEDHYDLAKWNRRRWK